LAREQLMCNNCGHRPSTKCLLHGIPMAGDKCCSCHTEKVKLAEALSNEDVAEAEVEAILAEAEPKTEAEAITALADGAKRATEVGAALADIVISRTAELAEAKPETQGPEGIGIKSEGIGIKGSE